MDVHKIGTFDTYGRFTALLDLNDGSTINYVRNTFKVTPYQEQAIYPDPSRRYGGSRQIGEVHGNGQIEGTWLLSGGTADATLARFDALAAQLESSRQDLFYLWRAEGASKNTYYDLRGGVPWSTDYKWVEFAGAKVLPVSAGWQVAPLALGDRLDIFDDFSTDTIAAGDYTGVGDGSAGAVTVTSGKLAVAGSVIASRAHTNRGYAFADAEATIKFTTGATPTSGGAGVLLKVLDTNNLLLASVDGGNTINLSKYDAGSYSNLDGHSITALSANTSYWLRFRQEGNLLLAELFTSAPTPLGTSPFTAATATLAGGNATKFGAGVPGQAGFRLVGSSAGDTRWDDFRVEPYTYNRKAAQTVAAHVIDLPGIPGTAPALVDAKTTVPGRAKFGLIGWAKPKGVANLVWNGSFENGTTGWSAATSTYLGTTGSIAASPASNQKYGTNALRATIASANQGAEFKIYRRFKKGQTYTALLWVKGSAIASSTRFGNAASASDHATTAFTPGATYALITTTWTPASDIDIGTIVVRTEAAGAGTFDIDGVCVYEGTTAPTGTQLEGNGAPTPFGLIEGEAAQNPTITSNAGSSGTNYNAALNTRINLDLSLIEPDDFTNTIALEIWAIMFAGGPGTATTLVSALAQISPTLPGTSTVYTSEYGTGTHTFLTGSGRTLTRAGTLVLPANGIWKLGVTAGGVLTGCDALMIVPARQRACNSTGKNSTDTEELVPTGTGETVKTIRSDLSGLIADAPAPDVTGQSTGLSGQLLEFPPGDLKVLHHIGDRIVDTPDTQNGGQDIATSSMAIHYAITPRYHLARSG